MNPDISQIITELESRIEHLEFVLNSLVKEDKYLFQRDIEMINGARIGKSSLSKLGFFGLAPIAQPSSTGETTGMVLSGSTVGHSSTINGNFGSTAYTLSDIVKHLKKIGILLK